MSRLFELQRMGQSVWLSFAARGLIMRGGLAQMAASGVRNVGCDPVALARSIKASFTYDGEIQAVLYSKPRAGARQIFNALVIDDVRAAADILEETFETSRGLDGYVCLDISPHRANDPAGAVAQARYFWHEAVRANLMVKLPATAEAWPVVEELVAAGLNVNISSVTTVRTYEEAARAFSRGLAKNPRMRDVCAVASVPVGMICERVDEALVRDGSAQAREMLGKGAVANARAIYCRYRDLFCGEEYSFLRNKGAHALLPVWECAAPDGSPQKSIANAEALIGPNTAVSLTAEAIAAFQGAGKVAATLAAGLEESARTLSFLAERRIHLGAIGERFREDVIVSHAKAYEEIITSINSKRMDTPAFKAAA